MNPTLAARASVGRIIVCEPDGSLYFRLDLERPDSPPARPGQFYLIGPDNADADPLLLRPMSVLADGGDRLSFLFKPVGRVTRLLASGSESRLRLIGPLGNPFSEDGDLPPILVGGGAGIPPLHFLSRQLTAAGREHRVIFGFNRGVDLPSSLLRELRARIEICCLDGSRGFPGHPLALLSGEAERPPSHFRSCGPPAMMDGLRDILREDDEAELSLEQRMACGVGVCRGCVVPVGEPGGWRYATVCREGPVFNVHDLCQDEDKHA